MALMPVFIGSFTGWRTTTPGARRSTGLNWAAAIGPLPSMGSPSALTTRPMRASPTGTLMMRLVRFTVSPSLISAIVAEQHGADLVFFQVHGDAGHVVRKFDEFAGHDFFQAVNSGNAVAHRDHAAHFADVDGALVVFDFLAENAGDFVRSNMSHNSFRLTFRAEAPAEAVQLAAHAAVVDRGTDARHHAADERSIDTVAGADAFAAEPLQPGAEQALLRLAEAAARW